MLEQAKKSSSQSNSLPKKLSQLITNQIKQSAEKKELEELQRDINRLKVTIEEKDAHLHSITDKMNQMVDMLKSVVQDTAEKEEQKKNLEERVQRILDAARKEKQEYLELKNTHQKTMMNLRAEHENVLFKMQARQYRPKSDE